jgi:hypothetical protein
MSSSITDSSKFNSGSTYFIPKTPAPGPGDVITGNLTVSGNLAVGGGFNVDGNMTSTDGTVNINDNVAIVGNLSATGTTTSTGLITATAGMTAVGPITGVNATYSGVATMASMQVPIQPLMGTYATPLTYSFAGGGSATLALVGNKAVITLTCTGIVGTIGTLNITSPLFSPNTNCWPMVFIRNIGGDYSIATDLNPSNGSAVQLIVGGGNTTTYLLVVV